MATEPVCSIRSAIDKVKRYLGCSTGIAQVLLGRACAVGEIRAFVTNDGSTTYAIPPGPWANELDASLVLHDDSAIGIARARGYGLRWPVKLSVDDITYWLKSQLSLDEFKKLATADKIKECTNWLVKERQGGSQQLTKEDYAALCEKHFGVTWGQFRDIVWVDAAKQAPNKEWGQPGFRPPPTPRLVNPLVKPT